MKFYSKCIDKRGKEVSLIIKGADEAEAREKLFKSYNVHEIVEMAPYEKYTAKNMGNAIGAKVSTKTPSYTYQKRHSRRRLYV